MRTRERTAALALATALILPATLLTACGSGSSPPAPADTQTTTATPTPTSAPEVPLSRSISLTLDAPSKRITGSAAIGQIGAEFDVTFVGNDAKGTRTSIAPGISSTTTFVQVGEFMFINADEHYWQTYYNLAAVAYLVHRWVRVAADDPNHADLVVLNRDQSMNPVGPTTRTGTDTVDGTPVVVLKDSGGNTFSVASTGEPCLLRFEGTQASTVGTAVVVITFSQIGAVSATITAPTDNIFDPARDFPTNAVRRA